MVGQQQVQVGIVMGDDTLMGVGGEGTEAPPAHGAASMIPLAVAIEIITILVKRRNAATIRYQVKKTTQIEKICEAYASKSNLSRAKLLFIYKGELIEGGSTTLEDLGLENGHQILAVLNKVAKPGRRQKEQETLFIGVTRQGASNVTFKVNKTTPIERLCAAYANSSNLSRANLTFYYHGALIEGGSTTVEDLGLENNDRIHAMYAAGGGGDTVPGGDGDGEAGGTSIS